LPRGKEKKPIVKRGKGIGAAAEEKKRLKANSAGERGINLFTTQK